MYHYNFTNDLRISTLDETLKAAAQAFLTDSVPSASENKSINNNYLTVGFYFNLKAKGNCAKLAAIGQTKKVVLNFIKKFQFPNPRTNSDYTNAKTDGILLAPMRDIVKLLHLFTLINPEESYLTKEEIINFIFYNNDLAKRKNYNLLTTASQIIQYRKDNNLPDNIDTDISLHEWNQPERQIREMIKTLNYSGCILENNDRILLTSESLSREREADLFEIINCNSYWNGESEEDFQKYMDEDLSSDDYISNSDNIEDELNRLYNLESNKDFAFQSIELLKKKNAFDNKVILNLTDIDFCKKELKSSFTILQKLPKNFNGSDIKKFTFIQGNNRYYPDVISKQDENYLITNDWYKGSSNHRDNRITYINFLRKILKGEGIMVMKLDKPFNRIIFGAPGTGKSYLLEQESSVFTSQQQVTKDINEIIETEIALARDLKNNKSVYNAIGFKYPSELDLSYKDIVNTYGNNTYEIYVGAKAAKFIPALKDRKQKYEENENNDYIENVKKEIASVSNAFEQNMNAIGFVYGDYLSSFTNKEIIETFSLDPKESKAYWLYKGSQASVVFDKEKKSPVKFFERVTFHPNYSYSQFVGTYKPVKSNLNQEEITYEYIPGPFMRVYANAKRNPEKNFLLLIEEINRANVAAVFGDVFQLLDRKSDGSSRYPINASEDQKNYLESCGINEDEIAIPSNMYIWATMNSADQGVLPMDAAFKRRWDFEYLDIDNEDAVNAVKDIKIPVKRDGSAKVMWNEFRTKLNEKLSDIGVNEDKLLGPFFLSEQTLKSAENNPDSFIELFESKVIMYLFEDVVKMNPGKLFNTESRRYSKICQEFEEKGMTIFGIEVAEV